jgi:hypothetical protein
MVRISPELVTSSEQVSPAVGLLHLASGQACLEMAFPSFPAVSRSSLPHLWEQGIPREGGDDCWL